MENNILYGGPMPENITDGTNSLAEFCYKRLKQFGHQPLIVHCLTGEEVTADQLLKRSIRVAECLKYHGIRSGDRIGIIQYNELDYYYVSFGAILLGAVVAPLNPVLVEREIDHLCKLSQPKIVFACSDALDKILKVATANKFIEKVIALDDTQKTITFGEFMNDKNILSTGNIECESQDIYTAVAVILSSSGTTGPPKGVELTQMNLLAFFPLVYLEETNYNISTTPFSHLSGFFTLVRWAIEGQKTILLPQFEEHRFYQCVQTYQIRSIFLPPVIMHILATSPNVEKYDLSSWKSILNGSGPVSDHVINKIYQRTSVERIRIACGLTESFCNFVQPFSRPVTRKSIGLVRPGVWAKIADVETGITLGPNQPGEIMLKSPRVMKGYVNDPVATKNAFDKDGFMHTGDLGCYDEEGEWYFIERIKELIKYNNVNISPSELEAILLEHLDVQDACVIGIPDEAAGEIPMAFVVRKSENVTESELYDFIASRVSSPKYLRGGVKFIQEIPKNSMGKKIRRILRNTLIN